MERRILNVVITCLITVLPVLSFGQQLNEFEISKVSNFIKVLGFTKYYHPEINEGNIDWDSVFLVNMTGVLDSDIEEYRHILNKLIDDLGEISPCNSCENILRFPKEWTRNLTNDWIDKDTLISEYLRDRLHFIYSNRHQGEGYYCSYALGEGANRGSLNFTNEKDYNDSLIINDFRYRLLALARYWNAIDYFFAYKYLLSQSWDNVLYKYISMLYNETTLKDYHLNITRLTREIEDSHSGGGHSRYLLTNLWDKKPPFDIITIDGKTIVKAIRFEELNRANDIKISDEILEIDGIPVAEAREELYDLCKGSNERNTHRAIDSQLLFGNTDTFNLSILRNGKVLQLAVTRFPYKAYWNLKQKKRPVLISKQNYAIVDISLLDSKEQIDSVMNIAKEKEVIIFDLRGYPMFNWQDFESHFMEESVPGFRAYEPSLIDKGCFKPAVVERIKLDKKEAFSGKKIILVNESTGSYGESVAMFFQLMPNTTVVGSQTAGANGNVARILLPGNFNASFSNIIIEYPDGRQSQKVGIQLDHQVELSVEDILDERDPYIEFAVEMTK